MPFIKPINMIQIRTEIIINATAQKIWSLLIDFENYNEWNPFIIESSGKAIVGNKISNTMKIQGKVQTFKPLLLEVTENQRLEWLGSLFFKGVFDGRHYFEIQQLEKGNCKLIQGEYFTGILVKPVLKKIKKDTIAGFAAMNEAIKIKSEK